MRVVLIFIFFLPFVFLSQSEKKTTTTVAIYEGDTVLYDELPAVPVGFGAEDFWKNYYHAKLFVPNVYYYAILVKELSDKYDADIELLTSNRARKKYIKKAKKNLKEEFSEDIKQMSVTRSFYLVKLIERETDKMAYTLLEEYLGKTKAKLWQGISRLGGADLKRKYDPQGDDGYIELVVREIEDGKLKYEDHSPKTEEGKAVMEKRKRRKKNQNRKK